MKLDEKPTNPTAAPDRAVRAVGDLAGEITHALKNPLAAFTTSLDLLLSGSNLDADDVKALHRVLRNELRKMDEMLLYTRELTRLRQLDRKPLDLAELVRARLDARAADLASADLTIERSGLDEAVKIRGDRELIEHAIDAVLQNAIDASEGGSKVTVTLETREAAGESHAVLRMRDEGPGIPDVALPNVFRMFYTTRKGAAGMGLTVARWIAMAHEGDVTLEARERGIEAVIALALG